MTCDVVRAGDARGGRCESLRLGVADLESSERGGGGEHEENLTRSL